MSLEDRLYPLLALYERMPGGMRGFIGRTYRMLPRSWRWGKAYAEFREMTLDAENWSEEQTRDYQLRELRRTLHHAVNHCPFYRRAFAKAKFRPESLLTFEDLESCPFLDKEEMQNQLRELSSTEVPNSKKLYITTGGSTGVPVGFYLHKGVSRPKEQAFLEAMWKRAGYFDKARLAVIRGHVTDPKASGRITSHDPTRDWLMLSSYHLTDERLPEYFEALEAFQPDLLHIYPSAALQIAEYLERHSQEWPLPLKALLCGSEQLTLPQKRLLERVFGCRVYRWYGHSERVVLAGEDRDSERLRFWPQYGFVEFGPHDADGLREVIGTSFHNMAMPLIRYRTGDYVRLAPPDATGLPPGPAVTEIAGQGHEFLVTATGRRISLTALNMHDAIFNGLYAVQFFQENPGVAEFRYIPAPDFHSSRLAEIEKGVLRKLGDDFRIVMRQVDGVEKTERGKHRWLVSRLPESGHGQSQPT